ncbi:hypothetical protein GUITHDRAFT_101482 [Guillardia theta CCMP2712]|uniref:NAD(P)-binding domain-containing protein n=1 Tax=Guillardia theta (strain CCMP2712) TaxID=905079 RepID=L1JXG7_GUITC|nr:hypothetical protein GUITHDRAFT_101482 [Guillardia theta CCMP2712]EKX53039.1 hypothetical protein GUITHDRAFT_101482 [Guillardia theta CCMP2712]|eukprot:XP_005840019.1 hypothetical protein GUITHDRAFT_101482 [Guillardia theta CCMP2712]
MRGNLLGVLLILQVHPFFAFLGGNAPMVNHHAFTRKTSRSFCMQGQDTEPQRKVWSGPGNPLKKSSTKSPSFSDDLIEDLTMKRFGNGWIFYGERETTKNKDYDALAKEAEDLVNQRVIRPDAVLVIGSLSVTGQWMTLKTMEQGLNARILTKEFDKAEDCFGTDGANLDIYYGDVFDDAQLENAMEGIKAVIYCDSGSLPFGETSFERLSKQGVERVVEMAKRMPNVRRMVLISSAGGVFSNQQLEAQRAGEALLEKAGLSYLIIRAGKMENKLGGMKNIAVSPCSAQEMPTKATITPADVADVAITALMIDDVVFKADMAAAAKGEAPPRLPRVSKGLSIDAWLTEEEAEPDQARTLRWTHRTDSFVQFTHLLKALSKASG